MRPAPEPGLARLGLSPRAWQVKQSLKALDELRVALNVCAGLEDCIATMERDRRLFADEVAAVAASG